MTIPTSALEGPLVPSKRPLPNLLVQGFQLGLRNWPCLVWVYVVNLLFGLLSAVPFTTGLSSYLDHSIAAQRIAGTLDIGQLGELLIHLRNTSFFPMVMRATVWLHVLQILVLFVFFAGSVFVFVSAEPPRLSVILRGGIAYFWRFVRAAIVAACVGAALLGILFGLRAWLLDRLGAVYVEQQLFLYSAISAAVVLLVGLIVRLWWDLIEVYIVRNAMDSERRVREALLPSLRLLFRYFFRLFGSFLLAGFAGVCALAFCLYLWKSLPAHQVWIAALLAQLGLFLLLAGRFWQRGLEASLVMSADPPRIAQEEMAAEEMMALTGDDMTPLPAGDYVTGMSEPTLRDLVQKLRSEPWANPDVEPAPLSRAIPISEIVPSPAKPEPKPEPKPDPVTEPYTSLLDRHEQKFPLGGLSSDKEFSPRDPGIIDFGPLEPLEKPRIIEDSEEVPPPPDKKPLP
jgi:hypothetical protein